MQPNPQKLEQLLAMSDAQLGAMIEKIAREAGLDPSVLNMQSQNITKIRQALGSVSADELKELNVIYESHLQNKNLK